MSHPGPGRFFAGAPRLCPGLSAVDETRAPSCSGSLDGTHLGHNLPDSKGNRYCINLVCASISAVRVLHCNLLACRCLQLMLRCASACGARPSVQQVRTCGRAWAGVGGRLCAQHAAGHQGPTGHQLERYQSVMGHVWVLMGSNGVVQCKVTFFEGLWLTRNSLVIADVELLRLRKKAKSR